ncbi:unnamed protein product [Rhodiola kirilowii]
MTGNSKFLMQVRPVIKKQFVTFGDGGKGQVIGGGTLKVPDLPVLKDRLLVEGLKVNLISISQLCDGGYHVKFTHDSCHVLDNNGGVLMKEAEQLTIVTSSDPLEQVLQQPACLARQMRCLCGHRRLGHLTQDAKETQII